MGIDPDRQRPFPTLVIVSALVLFCLFPGQGWIARLLPGIAGVATIDPSLTILDIPVRMPVTIDLVLVAGLFLLGYAVVILLYPSRPGMHSWREALQRIGAVFAGVSALLFCTAIGALISYLVKDHLPKSIRTGIYSLAINADTHVRYVGSGAFHLRGDVIILVCFIIGSAICIHKINKPPRVRKVIRLTREQQMTPYQRMLRERRELNQPRERRELNQRMPRERHELNQRTQSERRELNQRMAAEGERVPTRCYNRPVGTIQPDAVNYMPLE